MRFLDASDHVRELYRSVCGNAGLFPRPSPIVLDASAIESQRGEWNRLLSAPVVPIGPFGLRDLISMRAQKVVKSRCNARFLPTRCIRKRAATPSKSADAECIEERASGT